VAVSRTRPRSTRLLVIVFVSISLVIITLDFRQGSTGPLAEAGKATKAAMAPLQEAVSTITEPVGDFFRGLANLPSLAEDNARLQEELADARAEAAAAEQLRIELDELYDVLDLRTTLDPDAIPATVIGNGISNFEWSITIDKGSGDGIEPDMPVVTGDPGSPRLVGLVTEVTPISSEVRLTIDPDWAAAGALGTTGETGTVIGRGPDDLRMELIESGTEIDLAGDPIPVFTVSYSLGDEQGLYPPNLLIGTVSQVLEGTNELQPVVLIRPAVDFSALSYVLVLTPAEPEEDTE
jgi:rod shape-determining protein MreC